jgi:phosphatidate cytidylyltransferase
MVRNQNLFLRFISSFIIIPIVVSLVYFEGNYLNFFLLIVLIIGFFEAIKLKKTLTIFLILFLFFIFLLIIYDLKNLEENGKIYIFFLLLVASMSDIGGFFFGKLIGGKKISYISPNKTYAGFFGSFIFSQLSLIYLYFFNIFDFSLFFKIIFIFSCSLSVIIGDLIFSYFKRINNIKDYSRLLPGHGGLFDRIDGLILLSIYIYIFKNFIL